MRFTGERKDMPEVYTSFMLLSTFSRRSHADVPAGSDGGRPASCCDTLGAIPGLITPDVTGVLVDPGDAGGLAQAILRVLTIRFMRIDWQVTGASPTFSAIIRLRRWRALPNLYRQALADRCIAPPTPRAAEG